MRYALALALLLTLAACTAPAPAQDTAPQETFSCPDGTVVTDLDDCPQPEQEPQATQDDETAAEQEPQEDETAGLFTAKFDRERFNEVFTTDNQPTPPVGSSLRDIQARALQKTLDGYSYTYFKLTDSADKPQYQTARVSVRADEVAINYPEPVDLADGEYDRVVNGLASCMDCQPNTPEPTEVAMPDVPQPLDILLRLSDASEAQEAQSIDNKRTLKLDATLDTEEVTVFVDRFSGLPLEVRYDGYTDQFKQVTLSAPDDAFETIEP